MRQKLYFNNKNISQYGVIEKAYYSPVSSELIFEEVSDSPDRFIKRKRKHKELIINFRVITKFWDVRKTEENIRKIVKEIYSEDVKLLQLNDRFAWAILDNIDKEIYGNTALLTLHFILIDGVWLSDLKVVDINSDFINQGDIKTNEVRIKITPTKENIILMYKDMHLEYYNLTKGQELIIDLKNRISHQGEKYVPVTLTSDYFYIKNDEIVSINSDEEGVIEYREVYL